MKKTIITILSLIVLLAVIVYGYEFIFNKPIIEAPTPVVIENSYKETAEVKEQYKNSTYTFVGDVQVPTPCHTLTSKVNTLGENSHQIEVATIAPKEGVVCAQVLTNKSYKVSFKGSEEINISLKIDGVDYDVNRFLIPEGENIDTFKIEVKG